MSTTKPLTFPMPDTYIQVDVTQPLADGVIIPFGTVAGYDAVANRVKPATGALIRGGNFYLLGIALDTWDNSNNQYSSTGPRMLFARGCQWLCPNNVGSPGLTFVGQPGAIYDNNSVTPWATGDIALRVDAIYPDGSVLVFIP